MIATLAYISIGASAGAILRWLICLVLNSAFPAIPPGTLSANLLGSYLIGLALSLFSAFPDMPQTHMSQEFRLMIITGFLGSLTTFSSFTAEVGALLQAQRILTATAAVGLHVCGSLIMLFLGMGTFTLLRSHILH